MKNRIWISAIILAVVILVAAAWYFRPVGTVEGPEWDILHVDGVTYISERSTSIDIPYNRSDRGTHIGIIMYRRDLYCCSSHLLQVLRRIFHRTGYRLLFWVKQW